MNCPKCSNENVQITSRAENNASGWWGVVLLFFGSIILLGIFGLILPVIGAIAMSFAPKTETVAICQNCGNTFDPKTKKELN